MAPRNRPSSISADSPPTVDTADIYCHYTPHQLEKAGLALMSLADQLLDQVDSLPDEPGGVTPASGLLPAPASASVSQSTVLKRGVNYSHEGMIELIIANPGISQNSIAAHFGYSPSWISTIMASDAFQAQLAKRRSEVINPILLLTAEERFRGVALRATEILEEKLKGPASSIPDSLAIRAFDVASRAAGFGRGQDPPPAAPSEIHVHLEALGGNLTNLLRRKKVEALEPLDAEIIPQVPA